MSSRLRTLGHSLRKGLSYLGVLLRRSIKLSFGFGVFLILAIIGVMEPYINGYRLKGRSSISFGFLPLLPPSWENPLGTDHFGRDILALQFTGLRYSLTIGVIAGGVAIFLAIVIATIAGYMGGKWDAALNSVTNAVLVIPTLPILLAATAYVRLNLFTMSIALAIFQWPWTARTIRAQILSMKERPYVQLAKMTGCSNFEIMFKEILPNLLPFIGVGFAYAIVGAILAETGIRLIGLGPGEIPTLGLLLGWAMSFGVLAQGYYLMVLVPAALLILIFLSLNLINMGLEDTFNPRLKKVTGM